MGWGAIYRKLVWLITAFFAGVSGVFLLSGAGSPGLRLLVAAVFFISLLNLSLYARELYRDFTGAFKLMGGQSAEPEGQGGNGKARGGPAKGDQAEGGQSEGGRRPPEKD
ncbi:MAG: hypothetical protein LBP33_11155 [Candidatus Adiutrix sp.]|jgi:hypothetical protein|nr:hypothetical protein [Candidatus Adiutrix sp.]